MVSFTQNQQWKVILDDKSSNFNNQILKQYLHILLNVTKAVRDVKLMLSHTICEILIQFVKERKSFIGNLLTNDIIITL